MKVSEDKGIGEGSSGSSWRTDQEKHATWPGTPYRKSVESNPGKNLTMFRGNYFCSSTIYKFLHGTFSFFSHKQLK